MVADTLSCYRYKQYKSSASIRTIFLLFLIYIMPERIPLYVAKVDWLFFNHMAIIHLRCPCRSARANAAAHIYIYIYSAHRVHLRWSQFNLSIWAAHTSLFDILRPSLHSKNSKLPYKRFKIDQRKKPEWYVPKVNLSSKVRVVVTRGKC